MVVELPQVLAEVEHLAQPLPARAASGADSLLPTLLSQTLLAFAIEFDRESAAPLTLCANALRVLGEKPIPVAEIPRLTGGSPEMAGIGWQLKRYVVIEADPAAKRGKVVRLAPAGLAAQRSYYRLTSEIESRWATRFGGREVCKLREGLVQLFERREGKRPLLAAGLVPPTGVVRAGTETPALGRLNVAAAARQRMRDLVAQTEAFVSDPAAMLPHYPLWDMNRGFGP
jgi:hypothetical protein